MFSVTYRMLSYFWPESRLLTDLARFGFGDQNQIAIIIIKDKNSARPATIFVRPFYFTL